MTRIFVRTGWDICRAINSQPPGSVASLDVVSHGNQAGIHIARKLAAPVKAGFIMERAHLRMRQDSDRPQSREDAEFCEESIHGLYTDWVALKSVSLYYNQIDGGRSDVALLSDIKYDRFSVGAHVELHGCLTAEMAPFINTYLKDNFAKQLSECLPKNCTVVGHTTRSNPNIDPSRRISDYRHGAIRVYRNGTILKENVDRARQVFPNSSTP